MPGALPSPFSCKPENAPGEPAPVAKAEAASAGFRPGVLVALCGAICALFGTAALLGWHLNLPFLTYFAPSSTPMRYNAGLCFLLSGGGLALACAGHRRLALLCGTVLILFGTLTISEYATGASLGVDEAVLKYSPGTGASLYPGRIALNGALCFTLVGTGLCLLAARAGRAGSRRAGVTLGSLVLGLGLAFSFGYITGLPGAYTWGRWSQIPLPSAIAFLAAGTGLLGLAWQQEQATGRGLRWLPFPVGLTLLATSALLWQALDFAHSAVEGLSQGALPETVLAVGVLMSLLATFTVWLAQKSRLQVRQLRSLNEQLELAISRRQKAEERQAQLAAILEATPDFVSTADTNGRILYYNRAARAMVGLPEEADLSQRRIADNHPQWATDVILNLGLPTAVREGSWQGETALKGRDGNEIPISQVIIAHKGHSQTVELLATVARDITERKRAEEALRQRTVELEMANKELESFSYSVSHDLRGPLRSIDGFSQILLEDYQDKLDNEGKDYLRRLRAASQTMGQLIDDLLQLSRVTRSNIKTENIDLSLMALGIAAQLARQELRRVEFRVSAGMTAQGDRRLLQIALGNLLANAYKFTSRQPAAKIQFRALEKDGKPVFCVQDNGAGFDMAHVEKLFGAFQRLHPRSQFEGTGIGLATVQRIVRRHGGRIWAEGVTDKGASFYFALN